MLRMTLTGAPEIVLNGKPMTHAVNGKLLALAVYLAVTGTPHTRDALADLLWGEMETGPARTNLRGVLYELRKKLGPYIATSRWDTCFDRRERYWLDVEVLQTYLTREVLQANPTGFRATLALYRGEFLAGFHVRNASVFDEWVAYKREHLRNLVAQSWQLLAEYALQHDDNDLGLDATNHLLALDSTHEAAHRQRMLFLARGGQPKSALAQYQLCQRALADELALTPAPETTALYEQIKAGAVFTAAERQQPLDAGTQRSTRPAQTTLRDRGLAAMPRSHRFYGRAPELAHLTTWLTMTGVQLVGVFGLPGQGKTQLVAPLDPHTDR